jgi:hypothetical protein
VEDRLLFKTADVVAFYCVMFSSRGNCHDAMIVQASWYLRSTNRSSQCLCTQTASNYRHCAHDMAQLTTQATSEIIALSVFCNSWRRLQIFCRRSCGMPRRRQERPKCFRCPKVAINRCSHCGKPTCDSMTAPGADTALIVS